MGVFFGALNTFQTYVVKTLSDLPPIQNNSNHFIYWCEYTVCLLLQVRMTGIEYTGWSKEKVSAVLRNCVRNKTGTRHLFHISLPCEPKSQTQNIF